MSCISSGHVSFCDPPRRRKRGAGFTLVELMVTIGIIALLAALLVPLLGRVREAGKRTKCAANLHSIGQAATLFANDHRGYFPACYRMHDTTSPPASTAETFPFRVPQFISMDTTHDVDDTQYGWQQYGSSLAMWARYVAGDGGVNWATYGVKGTAYTATLGVFTCPSSDNTPHEIDLAASTTQSQYGDLVTTNYMYLGGLSDQNIQVPLNVTGTNHTISHWGKAPPAVATSGSPIYAFQVDPNNDKNIITVPVGVAPLNMTVLATDIVYYSGSTPADGNIYVINHPQIGNPKMPDFQNVLYGDGRVEGHGREEFPAPLYDDNGPATNAGTFGTGATTAPPPYSFDFSMKFANGQPGYFYWGEPESTPLLAGLQPPSTDTATPSNPFPVPTGYSPPPVPKSVQPPVVANPPVEPPTEGNPGPIPN